MAGSEARRLVERVARESWGRLIAWLSARSRDVAGAEDALSEALRAALEHWPVTGIPERPEAWLLTAARRRMIDGARLAGRHAAAAATLRILAEEAEDLAMGDAPFPDRRLQLMFVCAHPAIDAAARAPLMLQTVLGLDAARIAAAFMVAPSTMGQRLTRAKTRIRDARMSFELPDVADFGPRLAPVLDAIYAAYGSGWDDVAGADHRRRGLTEEAIDLGRLLARLLPEEPETLGLLALMLHCEARRPARRTAAGDYVQLTDQDHRLWSWPMIREAEATLAAAGRLRRPGRYQIEAAIQSVHAARGVTGRTEWETVALLYEGLIRIAPTIGAEVGRAAAVAQSRGVAAGLALLDGIAEELVAAYQPYWALRAHLLRGLERRDDARAAFRRAIGLSSDAGTRSFLAARLSDLG